MCSTFLSTPSVRRTTHDLEDERKALKFLSTPSARRATGHLYRQSPLPHISIHALREEGDLVVRELLLIVSSISIHALREGGDFIPAGDGVAIPAISIHALREEGDLILRHSLDAGEISIHALREEGDREFRAKSKTGKLTFLSTPSARRATVLRSRSLFPRCDFYPRPPRGGRHFCQLLFGALHPISIHALREEGDQPRLRGSVRPQQFLSTPSARRATTSGSRCRP